MVMIRQMEYMNGVVVRRGSQGYDKNVGYRGQERPSSLLLLLSIVLLRERLLHGGGQTRAGLQLKERLKKALSRL